VSGSVLILGRIGHLAEVFKATSGQLVREDNFGADYLAEMPGPGRPMSNTWQAAAAICPEPPMDFLATLAVRSEVKHVIRTIAIQAGCGGNRSCKSTDPQAIHSTSIQIVSHSIK
jgi:hypothetical protein